MAPTHSEWLAAVSMQQGEWLRPSSCVLGFALRDGYARQVTITRRGLLLGAGAVGVLGVTGVIGGYQLIEHDVLPGRIRLNSMLGASGQSPAIPDVEPGPLVTGTYRSDARGGVEVGWVVAYPPGVRRNAAIPVTLALHGRDGSSDWVFEALSLSYFLADRVQNDGVPPFAIAAIDGGDATNWHPRDSGDDPLAMLTEEYVPMLGERGLSTEQIGLWGWSLGGYGALLLASQLGPSRVAAVVASSPALWRTAEEVAPDTFDGSGDFDRYNIFTKEADLDGIPVRIDIGDNDSFTPAVKQFRSELTVTPAGGVQPGSHDAAFWMRVAPEEIAFLGEHLAAP